MNELTNFQESRDNPLPSKINKNKTMKQIFIA